MRPGGRIALTTIEWAPGLTRAEKRVSAEAAPRAVGSRRPYPDLMASAGFVDIGFRDATDEYRATTLAWLTESEPVRDHLCLVEDEQAVEERLQGWRDDLAALDRGHLRRTLYWGARP